MAVTDGAFAVTLMATRAEYLAGSLSQLKPWRAEGITRRTFERRRARAAASAAVEKVPAEKRQTQREAEDLLIRRIHAYWDAQGMTHSDPEALSKALHAITLPEPLKHKDRRELGRVYQRARGRLPTRYDDSIGLFQRWDKSYDCRRARALADRFVTALGDRPPEIFDQLIDYQERTNRDHWPKRVRQFIRECERLENPENLEKYMHYTPQLHPIKRNPLDDHVLIALGGGAKTKKQLVKICKQTYAAISTTGNRLRKDGLVKSFYRNGGGPLWALADVAPASVRARDAIPAALQDGPMTVPELANKTGKAEATIKFHLHERLLPEKIVIRTKLGVYALPDTAPEYVSKRDMILAALKKEKGPILNSTLSQETGIPPNSLRTFLAHMRDEGTVIRSGRAAHALPGAAPEYVTTDDAVIMALRAKPMKYRSIIKHTARSRPAVALCLGRLKKKALVKQERRAEDYRLTRRGRARAQRIAGGGRHP
jgi:predicted transcriptional regulator